MSFLDRFRDDDDQVDVDAEPQDGQNNGDGDEPVIEAEARKIDRDLARAEGRDPGKALGDGVPPGELPEEERWDADVVGPAAAKAWAQTTRAIGRFQGLDVEIEDDLEEDMEEALGPAYADLLDHLVPRHARKAIYVRAIIVTAMAAGTSASKIAEARVEQGDGDSEDPTMDRDAEAAQDALD